MMGFLRLNFDKLWTRAADFPTFESNESQVRADMQYHPDAIKNHLNAVLDELEAKSAAAKMGAVSVDGTESPVTIQEVLIWLREAIDNVVVGSISPGSVDGEKLAEGAVDERHLMSGSVTESRIATGAVSTEKMVDGCVTAEKLAVASVSTAAIKAGAVSTSGLADGAVSSLKLAAASVKTVKLDDGAVNAAKIATGAVETEKLAEGAVQTNKIYDGSVTKAKLASDVTAAALGGAVPSVAKTATLASGSWSSKQQTISVPGVTASNHIVISPASNSYVAYAENMIRCIEQAEGSLTFQCEDVPDAAVTVNILIVG